MSEADRLHQRTNAEQHSSHHHSWLATELVTQWRNGQRTKETPSLEQGDNICRECVLLNLRRMSQAKVLGEGLQCDRRAYEGQVVAENEGSHRRHHGRQVDVDIVYFLWSRSAHDNRWCVSCWHDERPWRMLEKRGLSKKMLLGALGIGRLALLSILKHFLVVLVWSTTPAIWG